MRTTSPDRTAPEARAFTYNGLAKVQIRHDASDNYRQPHLLGHCTSMSVTCGFSSFLNNLSIFSPTSCRALIIVNVPRPVSAALRINQLFGAEPIPTVNKRAPFKFVVNQLEQPLFIADCTVGNENDLTQVTFTAAVYAGRTTAPSASLYHRLIPVAYKCSLASSTLL